MKNSKQLLKILVAEDDEDDYKLLYDFLNNIATWKFDIRRVKHYEDIIEELNNHSAGLCFCNSTIGNRNSVDLIDKTNGQTPVILLSTNHDYQAELQAIKAGAFDCLVKEGLNEEKLERCICLAIERINKLKALQESERKYKALFDKFAEGLFFADENLVLLSTNQAIKEIIGHVEKSSKEQSLLSFFNDEDQAAVFKAALDAHGSIMNYEAEIKTQNHSILTCSISAAFETDSNNKKYLHGTIKNISIAKKEERASLHTEKHAASGRFIRTLAHELRNPLNNIKLAVENLLPSIHNEEDTFFLSIVQRNAERINDLVTDLLNSSRPVEVNPEPLVLNELLDKITLKLQDKLTRHNITLHTHYDLMNAPVNADPVKLEKALTNIIENAIEAVNDNTGVVELSTVYHNDQLTLHIKDNGSGISDDHKDKIFEPYFTSKRNGIGLGLATALNILQSHQAKTEVHSTEGEGTIFSIQFAS